MHDHGCMCKCTLYMSTEYITSRQEISLVVASCPWVQKLSTSSHANKESLSFI